jgi:hypothetical protein
MDIQGWRGDFQGSGTQNLEGETPLVPEEDLPLGGALPGGESALSHIGGWELEGIPLKAAPLSPL